MSDAKTPIQRILVPHDFSDTAERALGFALDIAEKLHASVTVMHAFEYPTYGVPEGPVLTADLARDIEQAAGNALAGVAQRSRRPGVEVTTELRHGAAWSEIGAFAKEMQADLVVMGTHGRRGVARALLGSVAERVVRTSPCPVLTVHGAEREK